MRLLLTILIYFVGISVVPSGMTLIITRRKPVGVINPYLMFPRVLAFFFGLILMVLAGAAW